MGRRLGVSVGAVLVASVLAGAPPAPAKERVRAIRIAPDAKGRHAPGLHIYAPRRRGPGTPAPVGSESGGREPRAAVAGGLNQPGLDAQDSTPSDSTGAIGPSHYMEAVNSRIAVYSRSGLGNLATTSLESFAGAGTGNCDPQIQWDARAARWVYVMLDCDSVPGEHVYFGWSRTANPLPLNGAGWCRFTINTGAVAEDYPKLGHDDARWVVGTNRFTTGTFLFLEVGAYSIAKPPAGVTLCPAPAVTSFGDSDFGLDPDGEAWWTPMPANTLAATSNAPIVSAEFADPDGDSTPGTGEVLGVWHIAGSASSPALVKDGNVPVSPFGVPPSAPQPGTTNTLDTLDARLTQAAAAPVSGGLGFWTQHTIAGAGGRSIVRWYELRGASMLQQGTIDAGGGLYAFNGAISPTSGGAAAAIDFNVSSFGLLPQIRARSRQAGTPAGVMAGEVTLGASAAEAHDSSCGASTPCRWGDYAAASPDPSSCLLVWGTNQLITKDLSPGGPDPPSWGTRNFALSVGANSPPTASIAGPASVAQNAPATFASTSRDPDGCPVSSTWDLDADGAFDDGSGPIATTSFPDAGTQTVLVQARDLDGGTATGTFTLLVRDVTSPRGSLRIRRSRLRTVRRRGLLVRLSGSEALSARLSILVSRTTARKLRLRGRRKTYRGHRYVVIGAKSLRLSRRGSRRTRIRLTRRVRRRLAVLALQRRPRSLRILVVADLKDTSGNRGRAARRARLRR
jgi:PKD domain